MSREWSQRQRTVRRVIDDSEPFQSFRGRFEELGEPLKIILGDHFEYGILNAVRIMRGNVGKELCRQPLLR